jgi:hypothetical protein
MFEYKAAAWFAKDILTGLDSTSGGRITAIVFQPAGVLGFDDFRLELEGASGEVSTVDVQARYRQPLTRGNQKFRELLQAASTEISNDPEAFASRQRRLLLVVGQASPGHETLRWLCDTARNSTSAITFSNLVARAADRFRSRFDHIKAAVGDRAPSELYGLLSALDIAALDFDGPYSRCVVQSGNDLAELWVPPSTDDGKRTFVQLFWELANRGPRGAVVDERTLLTVLGEGVPPSRLAPSRRTRLHAIRDASKGRVIGRLVALGVPGDRTESIADQALAEIPARREDPIYVAAGEIGVGKSTELERLLRQAATDALENRMHRIPVHIEAFELRGRSLRDLLLDRSQGLGRPESCGVFAVVDGLDEVGMTIEEVLPGAFAILSEWPGSQIVLGSRDQGTEHSLPIHRVDSLSDESALRVLEILGVDSRITLGARPELVEVLHRPLFAILHGLYSSSHSPGTTSSAQLVSALAEHAVRLVASQRPEVVESLSDLAARLIDLGGAAEPHDAGLSAIDVERLRRSRILDLSGGLVRFQLAILGEWFAAQYLLVSTERVASIARDPARALRWRHVLAQAVAQADEGQADDLLEVIVRDGAAALSAWVLDEAVARFPPAESRPELTSSHAAQRVRRALSALTSAIQPVSDSLRGLDHDGRPEVGVRVENDRLELAVPSKGEQETALAQGSFFQPRPSADFEPSEPGITWLPYKSGKRPAGSAWPWPWPLDECVERLDRMISVGVMATTVEVFRPELAWRYAHAMLGRDATRRSEPVAVSELAGILERFDTDHPGLVEAGIQNGYKLWRLSEGRRFVEELELQGITEIQCPWPPPDARGGWISGCWSAPQLLSRLHAVGPAVLDGYKAMVDQWIPSFSSYLPTYRLLPATIRGMVWVPDGEHGIGNMTHFEWRIDPAEGAENSARWELVGTPNDVASRMKTDFEAVREMVLVRRPQLRSFPVVASTHFGDPDIYISTPASRLARSLLHSELRELKWCKSNLRAPMDDPVVPPRFAG